MKCILFKGQARRVEDKEAQKFIALGGEYISKEVFNDIQYVSKCTSKLNKNKFSLKPHGRIRRKRG